MFLRSNCGAVVTVEDCRAEDRGATSNSLDIYPYCESSWRVNVFASRCEQAAEAPRAGANQHTDAEEKRDEITVTNILTKNQAGRNNFGFVRV
jgi:hypothetical protein